MVHLTKISTLSLLILSTFTSLANARVNTQDYWNCSKRIGGKWTFGVAPSACEAKTFISENFVNNKFSKYIFNEKKSESMERVRYMTEMSFFVKEVAKYYIKKRKPNVSKTEIKWWTRAVLTITHQESFMSHYRKGRDSTLRLMRGDFGHGHGLMQVDDRYHYTSIKSGKAANLIDNLFYALDIYYKGWEKAPRFSCVRYATNYYNRARAAYGQYNGGAYSACRFKNTNHTFARNDNNFKDKFDNQRWNKYISNNQKLKEIDVACLSNSRSNTCGTPKNKEIKDPTESGPLTNISSAINKKVLKYRGLLCAQKDKKYHCISQPEQRFCLVNKYKLINEVVRTIAVKPIVLFSAEEVCGIENGLLEVGDFIKLKKNINLRKTPGGLLLSAAKANQSYQILDVVVTDKKKSSRYYLLKQGSKMGYIYAGNKRTHQTWGISSTRVNELLIPVKNTIVSIITKYGTNLRQTPGGKRITAVPKNTQLKVINTVIIGETNMFYIEVEYRGQRGFMYSGQINPNYSITDWIKFL